MKHNVDTNNIINTEGYFQEFYKLVSLGVQPRNAYYLLEEIMDEKYNSTKFISYGSFRTQKSKYLKKKRKQKR